MQKVITKNSKETQELGKELAKKMQGGEVVCLSGELGSGKTTFTQGFLKELGAKGPYNSPTFLIMKEYKTKNKTVYHIDAYRVGEKDILNLSWEEIITSNKNVVIVEWAERIKKIIPDHAVWLKFEWLSEDERKIIISK